MILIKNVKFFIKNVKANLSFSKTTGAEMQSLQVMYET